MPSVAQPIQNGPTSSAIKWRQGVDWVFAWRLAKRLPAGGLAACAIILGIHLLLVYVVYPYPVVRDEMRQKVLALTHATTPALIISGDSRGQQQLMPSLMTDRLGWPRNMGANVAVDSYGVSASLAGYREFADRFALNPIMVVCISPWSVNDRSPTVVDDTELLWGLGWRDRIKLLGIGNALRTSFIPERRLRERLVGAFPVPSEKPPFDVAERGFYPGRRQAADCFSKDAFERQLNLMRVTWYQGPEFDGIRWEQTKRDLATLIDAGVQVVLFDGPMHPGFLRYINGTPEGEAHRLFQEKLAKLSRSLNVPLLQYQDDWYQIRNPDEVFLDVVHVNRAGAELLSARVGADLQRLMEEGRLVAPLF